MSEDHSAEERISQMIQRYEKELLRLCCIYLKDASLAEDAVQETFWKAYRNLHAFRGNSSPRTWLVRIAINVCKDLRRTAWFRSIKHAVALDRVQIAHEDSSLEAHSELVRQVMDLPTVCKDVVLLYYYEGFTLEQIAAVLHVSTATVYRRLEKAKVILKANLEGGMGDEE